MKSVTAIRFIIETVSRKCDANGNRSHFSRVTSTASAKTLTIADVGGTANAEHLIAKLVGARGWPTVYVINTEIGAREFNQAIKRHDAAPYEHQVTADMIATLEMGEAK